MPDLMSTSNLLGLQLPLILLSHIISCARAPKEGVLFAQQVVQHPSTLLAIRQFYSPASSAPHALVGHRASDTCAA